MLSSPNNCTSFSPPLCSESENSMAAKWLMSRAKKVDLAPRLTGAGESTVGRLAERCPKDFEGVNTFLPKCLSLKMKC